MSLFATLKGAGPSGFGYGSTAEQVSAGLNLKGKTMLVTGCNSGLGFETTRVLTMRGARVIGLARTVDKAERAGAQVNGEVLPVACELSEPASVRAAILRVKELGHSLDVIICNAGIMALPKLKQRHGYELQFFTNHIGHSILVLGLLDQLSDDGRVVVLSSAAHRGAPRSGIEFDNLSGERGYSSWKMYGQSKLANLLFAKELALRLMGSKKTVYAIHPGVIHTNLARHMGGVVNAAMAVVKPLVLKSVAQGAATQVYCAVHPDAPQNNGEYWADCNVARTSRHGRDGALAKRLWQETERIIAAV
ncbi:MAG TPA: SDR family oxidoreductase [Sorangium sp.]|nr:SDR family oxidoreductase [Sorangium sp.]